MSAVKPFTCLHCKQRNPPYPHPDMKTYRDDWSQKHPSWQALLLENNSSYSMRSRMTVHLNIPPLCFITIRVARASSLWGPQGLLTFIALQRPRGVTTWPGRTLTWVFRQEKQALILRLLQKRQKRCPRELWITHVLWCKVYRVLILGQVSLCGFVKATAGRLKLNVH